MAWNANMSTQPGSLYSVIFIETTTANKQGYAFTTKTPKAKASVPDSNTLKSGNYENRNQFCLKPNGVLKESCCSDLETINRWHSNPQLGRGLSAHQPPDRRLTQKLNSKRTSSLHS